MKQLQHLKQLSSWPHPLTPVVPITLLTSSPLHKIDIIQTQVLQEEEIFPITCLSR